MSESLREVLAKVKQQREAEKLKQVKKEDKPAEEIEEEPMETEEELQELPELPPVPVKKPQFKPKPLPQSIPVPQPMPIPNYMPPETPQMPEIKAEIKPQRAETELIMEEIELLHNNGIFRRELLVKLGQLNKNLADLNKMLGGI